MSHTDKTRPIRVKAADHPAHLEAMHDHRDPSLPCDLPSTPAMARNFLPRTRCTWEATRAFWNDRANGCGCPLCSDQFERKAKAKRSRRDGRRYAKGSWQGEF